MNSKAPPHTGAVTALSLFFAVAFALPARAHFPILLPDAPSVARGDEVRLELRFGHPFEHELADLEAPQSVRVRTPRGALLEPAPAFALHRTLALRGGKARIYRMAFEVSERGDWLIGATLAPKRHGNALVRDHVKVIVHAQAERGWDARLGQPLEICPLTRPYGLPPGATFRARVWLGDKSALVGDRALYAYVERYNERAPKRLPPEEQITRTERVLMSPSGSGWATFSTTLPEPGWWVIAVEVPLGPLGPNDLELPVDAPQIARAVLWVHVDEPVSDRRPSGAGGSPKRQR